MKAVVVGAGIGGLTAALCLHRRGITVDVFEQADAVRELGVGFNILPPAVAELATLGLLDELDAVAVRTGTLIMTTRRGQSILRDPRGIDAGWPFPQFSIHRGHLQRVLHDALGPAPDERWCTSITGSSASNRTTAVCVPTSSIAPGRPGGVVDGDVLIGADGIHSSVRAQLVPGEGEPLWNGSMLWRGATEWPMFLDGRTMIVAGGNDGKLVVYPIGPGRTPATRLTNWGVVGPPGPPGRTPPRPATRWDLWSQPGRRDQLAPHLARFTSDVVDVAGLVAATNPIYEYPLCDREPLTQWSSGRVTLLETPRTRCTRWARTGRPRRSSTPPTSPATSRTRDVVDALAAYERDRREPTNRLVRMNRVGGPERVIDLVEGLAPDGFDDIDDVIAADELRRIVADYAAATTPRVATA